VPQVGAHLFPQAGKNPSGIPFIHTADTSQLLHGEVTYIGKAQKFEVSKHYLLLPFPIFCRGAMKKATFGKIKQLNS
jgi:hypothetical protein